MGTCLLCKRDEKDISRHLGVCGKCLREKPEEAREIVERQRLELERRYGLPAKIPRDKNGRACNGCGNSCRIPENGLGFCGLVRNLSGELRRETGEKGLLSYYYDPLPTNCVPADFCAGSGGAGYPKWCRTPRGDLGYLNLAVFMGSCTYACLFCQNYSFRHLLEKKSPTYFPHELAQCVNERVACVCFFGGDPSSQMLFVQKSSELMHSSAKEKGRLLRICLETNLNMRWDDLERFASIPLESGGGIKADLKAWTTEIIYALCGIDHRVAFINFKRLAKLHAARPEVPFLRASTLLVPGYIDDEEIRAIASFIADLDTSIPYSLLAFHPTYYMRDLPLTRRKDAERYLSICKRVGLEKVRIGNPWLLA